MRFGRFEKIVSGVVLTLGVVAAVLGFAAESYRIKSSDVRVINGECIFPDSPALVLGFSAALILFVAQFIVNVTGSAIFCRVDVRALPRRAASPSRSVAILCMVASWITFLNAFALLMAGAVNSRGQQYMWFGGQCNVIKPLVYAGGGLLSLATVVLGLIFLVSACSSSEEVMNANMARLSTVGPSPSPASQEPVLGHPVPGYYGSAFNVHNVLPNASQTELPVLMSLNGPPSQYPEVVTGYPKLIPHQDNNV